MISFLIAMMIVVAVLAGVLALVSFVAWENYFRQIKPLFAIRCIVALTAYMWILHFLPRFTA
jgi:Tfp pilus assembly protein PilE